MKRFAAGASLVMLALLLTGCVAQLGTGWAGVTVLSERGLVAFAYEDTLSIVNMVNGAPVSLNTAEGNPVLDNNGNPRPWQIAGRDLDNAKFFAAPLEQDDDTLLVLTYDRRLLTFDRMTGAVGNGTGVQVEARGNAVTNLLRQDDILLIGLQDRLSAVDAESFEPLWSVVTGYAVWSTPLVVEETVYFTSLDHFLYAVNLADGAVRWQLDLGAASASTPAYDAENGWLYVGTFDNKVLKIAADGGEVLASYDTENWVWGSPVLVGDMLYAVDLGGNVYKLDAETLTLENGGWRADVADAGIRTAPLVIDEFVVVGSRDQSVYWLNQETGSEVFSRALDGEILADLLYLSREENPQLPDDLVVVSTLSNRESLVAFGARNGERIWTYRR